MAGGVGSRFWPVSTQSFPKQFHDMLGTGESLLQRTFKRLSKFIPPEHIFILTNQQYKELVLQQLPQLTQRQVLLEPALRNTAPCILYAALKIQKENPQAVMVVAPSDHWIENEAAFERDVTHCFALCREKEALATLGIPPTFPNTGYGYIQYKKEAGDGFKKVNQFTEKPDYETAKRFVKSGDFLWNAGIFIWSAATITSAFKKFQPRMYAQLQAGADAYNTPAEATFIEKNYAELETISIDYAILEKAENVYVLPATFDWNDLGTWGSLHEKLPKDGYQNAVVQAHLLAEEASGNIVRSSSGKWVVLVGLNDYIVVDHEDTLLICPKSREQDIKRISAKLTEESKKYKK